MLTHDIRSTSHRRNHLLPHQKAQMGPHQAMRRASNRLPAHTRHRRGLFIQAELPLRHPRGLPGLLPDDLAAAAYIYHGGNSPSSAPISTGTSTSTDRRTTRQTSPWTSDKRDVCAGLNNLIDIGYRATPTPAAAAAANPGPASYPRISTPGISNPARALRSLALLASQHAVLVRV